MNAMSETTLQSVERGHKVAKLAYKIAILFLVVFGAMACGGDDAAERDDQMVRGSADGEGRARFNNLSRGGLTPVGSDLNQDGEDDQWILKDGDSVKRIERDINFDGEVDMWQYPDGSGSFKEEEMDLDLDGTVDVVVYYENGVVTRKEISLDFQSGFSIVKFYDAEGNLLRVERDTNDDGKADAFDYYEDGQRVRTGIDKDGDGTPDTFDDLGS